MFALSACYLVRRVYYTNTSNIFINQSETLHCFVSSAHGKNTSEQRGRGLSFFRLWRRYCSGEWVQLAQWIIHVFMLVIKRNTWKSISRNLADKKYLLFISHSSVLGWIFIRLFLFHSKEISLIWRVFKRYVVSWMLLVSVVVPLFWNLFSSYSIIDE